MNLPNETRHVTLRDQVLLAEIERELVEHAAAHDGVVDQDFAQTVALLALADMTLPQVMMYVRYPRLRGEVS